METMVLTSQEDEEKLSITSDICSQETSQSQLFDLIDGMRSFDLRFSDSQIWKLSVLIGEVNI